MKNLANKFRKLSPTEKLLHLAPIVIWFSYFPNFQIGRGEGMNFEFSLPLIFAVIFAIVGVFENWQNWKNLTKNRAVWLTGIFIFWNFLSVTWAENPVRAFLVSGVWAVLWLDFLVILSLKNLSKICKNLEKILICSAFLMSILAIFQVIYGAFTDWGLCAGCLARGFGFVRPSVFAIEPQFFGSLLLAPILLVWAKFLSGKKLSKFEFSALFVMLVAMYLTLSRGAIFALIPAMFLAIFVVKKSKISLKRRLFSFAVILSLSFGFGMNLHAIFTELNPRIADGYYDAVSKSVNQLSLGKISLPKKSPPVENSVEKPKINPEIPPAVQPKNPPQKAIFDGYVARSTDERTKLSNLAIQTWLRDPQTVLFGVGAGSAGRAIRQHTAQTGWDFEIVQNEFLAILLELGVVGLAIWAAIIAGFIWKTRAQKWLWAILLAFLIQWNFFSGLPNALHIYLILAAIFATIEKAYEKKSAINRRIHPAPKKNRN